MMLGYAETKVTVQKWTSDADAGCLIVPAMHAKEDQTQAHRFVLSVQDCVTELRRQTKERKTFGLGEEYHARGLAKAEHLTRSADFSNSFWFIE